MKLRFVLPQILFAALQPLFAVAAAPAHDQFKVAVYIPVGQVQQMKDRSYLEKSWHALSSEVKVDKVYLETYRSGVVIDENLIDQVKAYFVGQGVQVAGGIAYVGAGDTAGTDSADAGDGQFVSFCYTDPKQRDYVKHVAEITARHFDEIMLDDFFFNNTKRDTDISAKGNLSWTAFRLKLMNDVSRNLVLGPARAVNPRVKVIIKFPNWYEHFQANGYDLDQQPKIFDGIYTGTETRDPVSTDQHLQQYESYMIVRYFDNIAPGRNGGGWVDTYDTRYVDRYAEQLWDTMLAKTPQIMLFQYSDLLRPAEIGNRDAWKDAATSFTVPDLDKWHAAAGVDGPVSYAAAAGYALDKVNAVVGKLGKPIGIASYKPYQSTGEDFLQNYLGMIGLPVEMFPYFPENAHTVLLTEQAKFDAEIVAKIRKHLEQGGNVVITAALLKALEGKGIEQIADIRNTGNVLRVDRWWGGYGAGAGANLGESNGVLIPEISFQTNDAWPIVRGTANGRGAPLLLMDKYSKGILYVLTIPENANDLYSLPQPVLTDLKRYLMARFPVWMDAPAKVSLFAYDNRTFVVESYLDTAAPVTISVESAATKLRNVATGEVIEGQPVTGFHRRGTPPRNQFKLDVPAHSFMAFTEE